MIHYSILRIKAPEVVLNALLLKTAVVWGSLLSMHRKRSSLALKHLFTDAFITTRVSLVCYLSMPRV